MFFFTACKSKDESAEFFKRGVYHFKKNEIDKALLFFTEAIKKDPSFADPLFNRGIIYQNAGDLKAAETDLKKAIAIDKDFHEAKFQLAKLYSFNNQIDDSNALLKAIESKYSKSSDYFNTYGQNLAAQNDLTAAESNLQKALALNPKNPNALTNLGYVKLLQGTDTEAEKQFSAALKVKPDFTYALNNMGVLAIRKLNFESAIGYFSKIIVAEPKNQIFLNNLCLAYLENQEFIKAKEIHNRSRIIDDTNPYFLRNSAILSSLNNNLAEAESMFLALDKTNPEVEYLYYYLSKNYLDKKNSSKACFYAKILDKISDPWKNRLKLNC